jgi:hypothetical protein
MSHKGTCRFALSFPNSVTHGSRLLAYERVHVFIMARSVFLIIVVGLTATQVVGQALDFTLKRFGRVPVSDSEVTQIAGLASSTGRRLWLLRTPNAVLMSERVSYLFLEPDVFGKRVLRGQVLKLVATEPPSEPIRSPWKISESYTYGYIPTTGRQPGEIETDHDLGWPFILYDEFDDETVISLVEFIRSQPPIPMPAFRKSVPAAPIAGIARRDDTIVVGLRPREDMGDAIWLVRKDGQWVITRSETSVN